MRKAGRDRLLRHGREPRPQAVPHLPIGGDPGSCLRMRGEPRLDAGTAARIEPSIHEGVQIVLADGTRVGRGHFTLRRCPVTIVGARSRKARIRPRARLRRDITVPTGTASTAATSA